MLSDICKISFQMFEMNLFIWIQISLEGGPYNLTDNNSRLDQVMAWRPTCGKQLTELMITQFSNPYLPPDLGEKVDLVGVE